MKNEKKTKYETPLFSESYIWDLFYQICLGLKHLHSKGIIHRDIKTSNILYNENKDLMNNNGNSSNNDKNNIIVKIADLGISYQVNNDISTNCDNNYGTPLYYSPEMLNKDFVLNEKVDIWSLGKYI